MDLMAQQPAIAKLGPIAKKLQLGKPDETMSSRMEQQSDVFSRLQIAMVQAGEKSGSLVEALELLANYAEFEVRLRNEIKKWTFGTKLLLGVFCLVVLIVATFASGRENPGYLRILIALGLVTCFIGFGVSIAKRTDQGRDWIEAAALRLPLFERGNRLAATAKFLLGLSMMYKAGCGLTESVGLAGDSSGNADISKRVRSIANSAQSGESLSTCLERSGALDPETIRIIATGESSGSVDISLNRLADHYDQMAQIEIQRAFRIFVGVIGGIVSVLVGIWIVLFYIGQFSFL